MSFVFSFPPPSFQAGLENAFFSFPPILCHIIAFAREDAFLVLKKTFYSRVRKNSTLREAGGGASGKDAAVHSRLYPSQS